MKKYIFFILLLLFSFSVKAQFSDLMGSLSVQGSIMAASTNFTARGIYVVRKTKLLESIRQAVMEIRSQFAGNYSGIGPENLSKDLFSGMEWYIGQEGYDSFFIQLNNIDNQSCQFLISAPTSAKTIEINGNFQECSDSNDMKFIFN